MPRTAVGVPPKLARRSNRVLRPIDAADVYAHPRAEFARLTEIGAMKRLATGYYALTPARRLGDTRWMPDHDAVALGMAKASYGPDLVALMGISAARHHGAIPRALAIAVVAAPKQRPVLHAETGQIVWVKRAVTRLDTERIETELGSGWVTTVEQTLLDLADRPKLGGLPMADIEAAIHGLAPRADWKLLRRLAASQHKPAALQKAVRDAR